jgi:MSHA biogenesis protein MshE
MAFPEKIRLGDLLVQQKLITQDQLKFVLDQQKQQRNPRKLGRLLVENDFVTEEKICETLSRQLGIPYINLNEFQVNDDLIKLLKEDQARKFQAIVLEKSNGRVLVGIADPTNMSVIKDIVRIFFDRVDFAVVAEGQILGCIDRKYSLSQRVIGLD